MMGPCARVTLAADRLSLPRELGTVRTPWRRLYEHGSAGPDHAVRRPDPIVALVLAASCNRGRCSLLATANRGVTAISVVSPTPLRPVRCRPLGPVSKPSGFERRPARASRSRRRRRRRRGAAGGRPSSSARQRARPFSSPCLCSASRPRPESASSPSRITRAAARKCDRQPSGPAGGALRPRPRDRKGPITTPATVALRGPWQLRYRRRRGVRAFIGPGPSPQAAPLRALARSDARSGTEQQLENWPRVAAVRGGAVADLRTASTRPRRQRPARRRLEPAARVASTIAPRVGMQRARGDSSRPCDPRLRDEPEAGEDKSGALFCLPTYLACARGAAVRGGELAPGAQLARALDAPADDPALRRGGERSRLLAGLSPRTATKVRRLGNCASHPHPALPSRLRGKRWKRARPASETAGGLSVRLDLLGGAPTASRGLLELEGAPAIAAGLSSLAPAPNRLQTRLHTACRAVPAAVEAALVGAHDLPSQLAAPVRVGLPSSSPLWSCVRRGPQRAVRR